MNFNENLLSLRKQHGLSQEQLGQQVGVSRQTVSKWELGETTPELDKIIQLSDYFNISTDALIGHENASIKNGHPESSGAYGDFGAHGFTGHYEYQSKHQIFGMPLVHINIGRGIYRAKGIIAVGTISRGVISMGAVSMGLLSFGALSFGLISMAALSIGLLLSVGAIAVGGIAIGGFALGILAIGGCAVGIYSLGGCAIASNIAAGGYANAPIAIGDKYSGQITFDVNSPVSSQEIQNAILTKFPRTLRWIVDLFSAIF